MEANSTHLAITTPELISNNGEPLLLPKKNLLLGLTGSVATIKLCIILDLLIATGKYNINVMLSQRALSFSEIDEIKPRYDKYNILFYTDQDEWGAWKKKGDPVLHIDLRRWADILVIAPLSANTLAKIAGGLCDNLITCVIRAWDFTPKADAKGNEVRIEVDGRKSILLKKPIIVAPAMNTLMWDNPFTKKHLAEIRALNIIDMDTVCKELACKDIGYGAMAEPQALVTVIDSVANLL